MRRAALLLPLLATPALAQVQPAAGVGTTDPSFRLVNRDPAAVHEIFVSPTGRREWGIDRLGHDVLIPGRFARITLPPGQCMNDIRVVFADGRVVERRRVDTCTLSQMAFP